MAQMTIMGPLVTLIDSAGQQVQALEVELARLARRRDELNEAIQRGIVEMVRERGHELPEHWEAQPAPDGVGLVVTWDE